MLLRAIKSYFRPSFSTQLIRASFCTKCDPKDVENYTVIYRFPLIQQCSLLNKFKKYQLLAASTAIPGSTIACWLNLCELSEATIVSSVALASTVAIFSVGQLVTNLIGFVYFSEEKQEVKLSYLDFWGRRKNVVYGLEDFVPLSHSPTYITDSLFRRLYLYQCRTPYKLSIRFGDIIDEEKFKSSFNYENDVIE